MKNLFYCLIVLIIFIPIISYSQQSFCEGWQDGYKEGMKSKNQEIFITPICPIVIEEEQETYQNGFERGFEEATGKKTSVIFPPNEDNDKFCDGWSKGYTNTMNKNGRIHFMVPICPISGINEDSYDAGYIKGCLEAEKRLNSEQHSSFIHVNPEGTFCEGWEKGYLIGLQIWAEDNNESVLSKIIPICPIPKLNRDSYSNGFERGKQKAINDMNK